MRPADERDAARLTDYVDGELDERERLEFEALLRADEELRQEVDDARAARALLSALGEPRPVPSDFLRKVQRRARRNLRGPYFDRGRAPLFFGVSFEVVVVVALAAVAACWLVVAHLTDEPSDAPPAPAPASSPE